MNFPDQINPRKWAEQERVLEGSFPGKLLGRLAEAVEVLPESVSVALRFFRDEEGRFRVTGNVHAEPTLICQRCMGLMSLPITAEVNLAVVVTEAQIQSLPDDLDPWLVLDDKASLFDMVDEELVLALPLVSYHEVDKCNGASSYSSGEEPAVEIKENPFAALAALKGTSSKDLK